MDSQIHSRTVAPYRLPPPRADRDRATRDADRSRNRPRRWTQRYELVLRLYLAGGRTSEIAPSCATPRTASR